MYSFATRIRVKLTDVRPFLAYNSSAGPDFPWFLEVDDLLVHNVDAAA